MPDISLTDFLDIISSAGTAKLTKIREVKRRGPYSPAKDFYRPFREYLSNLHRNGGTKEELFQLIFNLRDPKKVGNYNSLIEGYQKWWAKNDIKWFQTSAEIWSAYDIGIRVNPELGLVINKVPHLIKLYLKADKLSQSRVDIITHLMEKTFKEPYKKGTVMSVLDIRRSKLIIPKAPIQGLADAIDAELAYINVLWPKV